MIYFRWYCYFTFFESTRRSQWWRAKQPCPKCKS